LRRRCWPFHASTSPRITPADVLVGLGLGIYDGAEVILKPVFGALVDGVGPRPVLFGGLVGFTAASAAFVIAGDPGLLGVARFGQGAAAAAFSPAASTLVARLTPSGAGVSVLSASAALAQPWAGRALDGIRLSYRAGTGTGLMLCAAGFVAAATIPGLAGLLVGAIVIGLGAGVLTPLGFAFLAASAPAERLGETMGAAEVGRELGDAGGPLLVGAIAAASTLSAGLLGAAIALLAAAVIAPAGFSPDRPSRP
jgi:MFS family permease